MEISKSALFERLNLISHSEDLGLYIHIPFCQKRCHFCAFYLTIHREDQAQWYLSALRQEIELYARQGTCYRFPLSTIYFGGGTPTALQAEQLTGIIQCLQQHFTLSRSIEITVEADPDTVSQDSLQVLRDGGVNRLSFGVQSLEQSEWQQLGRLGEMNAVTRAITMAKDVGFSNISIDIMYGLPGQTVKTWQRSLQQVIDLHPS
ncbi:MAG: coproporphyrinogen-III oxidase family protein, partial [Nitrospirales bacterium]